VSSSQTLLSEAGQLVLETEQLPATHPEQSHSTVLPYTMDNVVNNKHLGVNLLNEWDYPVFDLSAEVSDCILSMVRITVVENNLLHVQIEDVVLLYFN
jgi:hypothetical protein